MESSDPIGLTITKENIDAIAVSKETRSREAVVNDERAKKDWKALAVLETDVFQSGKAATGTDIESFENKISSISRC